MINLSLSHTNLNVVAEEWKQKLQDYLFADHIIKGDGTKSKKRTPYIRTMLTSISDSLGKNGITNEECRKAYGLLIVFKHDFNCIITANEKALKEYADKYNCGKYRKKKNLFAELMKALYEKFTDEYAYYFFKKLNIRTCPYCNRTYTFTCDDKIKTRPEFDHFYDKAEYPMLAVSFYNLVPSCHICNHIKGTKHIKINPYFHGFESRIRIADKDGKVMNSSNALSVRKEDDFSLKFVHPNKKEKANIDSLGLNQLYNEHKDYVLDIIEKAVSYNDDYKKALLDSFQTSDHSLMSVHDFVWGRYLDTAQQEKHPLSKLTKDLLEQMEIE